MNLTVGETTGVILATVGILAFIGSFIARISKLETRQDVCDEKHRINEANHLKQDAVNLRIEEHHIEVMSAISAISTKLDLTARKINK
jgi:hypothetical protein